MSSSTTVGELGAAKLFDHAGTCALAEGAARTASAKPD